MRIVIDMQGAQTESRFRGIGRYTMEFTQAVVKNRGDHEIFLVLNGLLPDTIETIREAFEGLLPQENIRLWYAPSPVKEEQAGNDTRREVAELIREAFIASLNPDVVHITSLFEGYIDCAVTSIGRFDSKALVSITIYDLIPLLNPKQYLHPNPRYKAYYQRKIEWLKNSSVMLGISDYTCLEVKDALGINNEKVMAISTAIKSSFKKLDIKNEQAEIILGKYGIIKPFVLYTGGADERKNLLRLIQAFAKLQPSVRNQYQLVFAGKMPAREVKTLKNAALESGVKLGELIFTGYISEVDLIALYNLCRLYVFPSWHEGFGLPALEAMACGAPVIGANTTSLPEVIGLEEAMFDPFDVGSICEKIHLGLVDENFRHLLIQNAEQQVKKFSWDRTARVSLNAWEKIKRENERVTESKPVLTRQQLLIEQIAQIVKSDETVNLAEIATHIAHNDGVGPQRQLLVDVSELCQRDSATGIQRVVRSYLHQLLLNPPENFTVYPVYATPTESYRYASRYLASLKGDNPDQYEDRPMRWQRGDVFFGLDMQHHVQLAQAESYSQLRRDGVTVKFLVYDLLPIELANFFKDNNLKELHEKLLGMIAQQNEAICISNATADSYQQWLENQEIKRNPNLKVSWVHLGADLEASQPSVGMPENFASVLSQFVDRPTFLSVSTIEPRKAQAQILDAVELLWAEGVDINLVLVGQQGWKVDALVNRINTHPEKSKRLFWLKSISDEYLAKVYQHSTCLVAASINEGFGLPLIEAARHKIPVIAREIPVFREVAGDSAFYFSGNTGTQLAESMKEWLQLYKTDMVPDSGLMHWNTWQKSAEQLKTTLIKQNYARKQLLVDISELVQRDAKSGIQRVVRSILNQCLNHNSNFKIEPVYATHDDGYRYARSFINKIGSTESNYCCDELIEYSAGDVFLGLDLAPAVVPSKRDFYQKMRNDGVLVSFVIYDLLPLMDGYFDKAHAEACIRWLDVATSGDMAICISKAVSDELTLWMKENKPEKLAKINISHFHLGADIDSSLPTTELPIDALTIIDGIRERPSFLLVSTIAPHKGHAQVLDAFEKIWRNDSQSSLVIVGKQGWMVEGLIERLRNHPEAGKRLFWLEGISDEYLKKVYEASTCLIAASYGEGFGLPLIEAAQHKIPIIARDIPVFREVAGPHATYFDCKDAAGLAASIEQWLELYQQGKHVTSDNMPWLTWAESAAYLLDLLDLRSSAPNWKR